MNNNEIILEIGEDENFYEIGSSEPFTGNASYAWPNGNKYVGELSANAQKYAASVQAGATTNAARIASNSATDQILNIFKNSYKAKGYDTKAAEAMAYTDYANVVKKDLINK